MTQIDQFESVFRAADKVVFDPVEVKTRSGIIVTDRQNADATAFRECVEQFCSALGDRRPVEYHMVTGDDLGSIHELLSTIERSDADLIITHRNLRIPATEFPYSLGVYVDVMSQVAKQPLLLMPHPEVIARQPELVSTTAEVMAVTTHLTGDHRLVSYAAHFTITDGQLFLCHIEDELVFERYIKTIEKIPDIESDVARETILNQLLKEPHEYIQTCRAALTKLRPDLRVEEIVRLGRRLSDYRAMIDEYAIDLLVMNTRVDDQLAMHGNAYALAVELRTTPLLLL